MALEPGIRVAVVAAMRQELAPLVRGFALRREPTGPGPGHAWRGRAGSHDVVAVVTGMGTHAAARETARLLDAHEVDHVLVVGIAGGIAEGLAIGDLLNPEAVVDERSGAVLEPTPLAAGVARGRLLTSDTLHNSPAALARLRGEGYVAVDMETAAVGAAAAERGLRWSVLRAVSDFAGDPRLDARVTGLARPDGTARPGAVARFVLTRPWRIPQLAALARGASRAVQVSGDAARSALL